MKSRSFPIYLAILGVLASCGTNASEGGASSGVSTSSGGTSSGNPARDAGGNAQDVDALPSASVTDCAATPCHYIKSGGTGSQTGTDWSNAAPALPAMLVRAHTYFVAGGSYPGRTFGTAPSGTSPVTIKKATESDHGTAIGWNGAYGSQANFTGGLEFTTSYWMIDGQTGGGATNAWQGNFGFKIAESRDDVALLKIGWESTADNITIQHVDMHGKGEVSGQGGSYSNDGLAVYGSSDVTLSYFHMVGVGRAPFFLSAKNLVVEHGWVESFFGSEAVHSEVASIWGFEGNVGDTTFRYNLFTDIQSTGGLMWDNSSNKNAALRVYGNVFYKRPGATWGKANGLIGGWTGGNGEEFHNAAVYNNTFVNVDQESLSGFPKVFSNNAAQNNLFYNSEAPNFGKFTKHDYNDFRGSGTTQGEPNGTTGPNTDPFLNAAAFDFRLKAPTAPGVALASPFDRDPLGKPRSARSRGAFEP
jgi:hypothetical protein